MAKDLVRTRRYVKKFILMKANLQAVSLKIQVGFVMNLCTKKYDLCIYCAFFLYV